MPTRFPGPGGTVILRAIPGLLVLLLLVLAVLLWPAGGDGSPGPAESSADALEVSGEPGDPLESPTGADSGAVDGVERSGATGSGDPGALAVVPQVRGALLVLDLLDSRDGLAAVGVPIAAHDMLGGWPYPRLSAADTDAQGRVELELPADRVLSVRIAETERFQRSGLRVEPLAEGERREMTLRLQPHVVTNVRVRVLAPDGRPVAGARVEPMGDSPGFTPSTTDGAGFAVLDDVRESSWAPLRAVADGYGPGFCMLDPDALEVEVKLAAEAQVAGTVRRADGSPAGGAWLEFRADPRALGVYDMEVALTWHAATDADGRYALGGLPAATRMLGSAALDGEIAQLVTQQLRPGAQQVDFQLGAPPVLVGRVVDTHGQPQAGIEVEAERVVRIGEGSVPLPQFQRRHGTSDAEGRFRFEGKGMAPGTWKVGTLGALDAQALRADASAGGAARWLPAMETVEIPAGAASAEVLLTLRAGHSIEGRFFDPDGQPVTRGWVRAFPQEGTRGPRVQTLRFDDQGGFRIGPLAPGRYLLRAADPVTTAFAEARDVEAGTRGLELRGKLPRGVRGRVVDAEGNPAQARLYAFDRKRTDGVMWAFSADGDGRFSISDDDVELLDFIAFRADGLAGLASAVRLTEGGGDEVLIRLEPAVPLSIAVKGIAEESWYAVARLRGQVICEVDPFHLENLLWLPEGLLELEVRVDGRVLASAEKRLVPGDPRADLLLSVPPQDAGDE